MRNPRNSGAGPQARPREPHELHPVRRHGDPEGALHLRAVHTRYDCHWFVNHSMYEVGSERSVIETLGVGPIVLNKMFVATKY